MAGIALSFPEERETRKSLRYACGMGLVFPLRDACFTVFSQRPDARIDGAEWARHAERFFATRIELSDEREYHDVASSERHAAATVTLTPLRKEAGDASGGGARICRGRPRWDDDLRAVRGAEAVGAGLAELAARCPRVWLVGTTGPAGTDDPIALRLAAIIAGIVLGPILTPRGAALFGPKTAREKLL
jgi:hypothetical protein